MPLFLTGTKVINYCVRAGGEPGYVWHAVSNKNHLVSGRPQIDTRGPSSGLHPLPRVLQTSRRVLVTRLACWCVWARERGPFSLSRGATFNELRLEIVEAFRDVFGIYNYISDNTSTIIEHLCIHHASWGEHLVNHPCTRTLV